MTPRTPRKQALGGLRIGRASSRHLHRKGLRTCVAPVEDRSASPAARTSADRNVVRGEG
ncbi:hypothetical protein ACIRPX_39705 [Streptomyces sp. NPDC101225]|uniref:hypothetical protein n=1 Tax=Streptomyces sp. NPDC101225 TaxID=3366135 RepID=UPI003826CF12